MYLNCKILQRELLPNYLATKEITNLPAFGRKAEEKSQMHHFVYFLLTEEGGVLRIGASKNLGARLWSTLRTITLKYGFNPVKEIILLPCADDEDLQESEGFFIDEYTPPLNKSTRRPYFNPYPKRYHPSKVPFLKISSFTQLNLWPEIKPEIQPELFKPGIQLKLFNP